MSRIALFRDILRLARTLEASSTPSLAARGKQVAREAQIGFRSNAALDEAAAHEAEAAARARLDFLRFLAGGRVDRGGTYVARGGSVVERSGEEHSGGARRWGDTRLDQADVQRHRQMERRFRHGPPAPTWMGK